MLLEVFKEVCIPSNCDDYQYIGFGSSFFSDFKLIHRELNISDMISIEGNSSTLNIKRCEYNKPFSCINIRPGYSYQVLPKLAWKKRSIVWLDYDKCLQNFMFQDIETCSHKAKPWSFLVISLRREFDQKDKKSFEEEFGDKVPERLKAEDLEPKICHLTIRNMILSVIEEIISNDYSTRKEEERLVFKQTFNYIYKDDAPMYTFGGIFILKSHEEEFEKLKFHAYDFVTSKDESINVDFPIITSKEYHQMTQLLPSTKNNFIANPQIDFVPDIHKLNYFNTYKYYPSYIEIRDL
ncbi:MAG: hypothetical protein ABS46_00995 [Cytophagaceae bacterium SCN 52-12]|nr:MAG: hypothetical protein ABS46_00995 [Cytophagaceae bacterium SCN 52-12]